MSYSFNPYTPDTHNIPTMSSNIHTVSATEAQGDPTGCPPRSISQLPAFLRNHMVVTHKAHNILFLTKVIKFREFTTRSFKTCIYHKVTKDRDLPQGHLRQEFITRSLKTEIYHKVIKDRELSSTDLCSVEQLIYTAVKSFSPHFTQQSSHTHTPLSFDNAINQTSYSL